MAAGAHPTAAEGGLDFVRTEASARRECHLTCRWCAGFRRVETSCTGARRRNCSRDDRAERHLHHVTGGRWTGSTTDLAYSSWMRAPAVFRVRAINSPSTQEGIADYVTLHMMKTIAITIDEDVLERVDRLAGRRGEGRRSRSRVIRQAVREHVLRLERQAEDEREAAVVRRHRARLARQARALVREQAKP